MLYNLKIALRKLSHGGIYSVINIGGPAGWLNHIHIKLNEVNSVSDNLNMIEKIFKKYNPDIPFIYHFADEVYARRFAEEQRTSTLVTWFAHCKFSSDQSCNS